MNYFLDDRINRAEILFPGVGCFLIAVCLGSAVHSSNAADNEEKLSGSSSNDKCGKEYATFVFHFPSLHVEMHHELLHSLYIWFS